MTNPEIKEMAQEIAKRTPYQVEQELFNLIWIAKFTDTQVLAINKQLNEKMKYINDPLNK